MAQIDKPNLHFNTKLYTGNGGTQAVTGVGFQPDLVWLKGRSYVDGHVLYDALRGTNYIQSNTQGADSSIGTGLSSLDSDGFTLGSWSNINRNSETHVSWNWKMNGAGSSNTDGSITATVSANTTAKFSIVKYTGTGANATVGHGLGVAPKMILFKDTTNGSTNWSVYHKDIGNDYRLTLNDNTARAGTSSTYYQSTDPSTSVFYLGSNTRANASGAVTIAYCFAEKKGFSKLGIWTGNGDSSDGPFIYTGFKPAFLLTKRSDAVDNWAIDDNTRSSINEMNNTLYPNLTNAEYTAGGYGIDFLSNGIKIRNNDGHYNGNANTYIYMAFAENPIVGSNNTPATAR